MYTTVEIVGSTEWIIDDACLVLFLATVAQVLKTSLLAGPLTGITTWPAKRISSWPTWTSGDPASPETTSNTPSFTNLARSKCKTVFMLWSKYIDPRGQPTTWVSFFKNFQNKQISSENSRDRYWLDYGTGRGDHWWHTRLVSQYVCTGSPRKSSLKSYILISLISKLSPPCFQISPKQPFLRR